MLIGIAIVIARMMEFTCTHSFQQHFCLSDADNTVVEICKDPSEASSDKSPPPGSNGCPLTPLGIVRRRRNPNPGALGGWRKVCGLATKDYKLIVPAKEANATTQQLA
ncbi:uncharacterized protein LOC117889585 [Drosophila subobscura]|uniref:uncharacterized protein LOC117889585 n=1 Tax=Drosophila subobscura TaxID=7241 RepID=UPI00155B219D|nr:uncharacterized protein LOC117889585 [Drosophila subobscura]